MGFENMGYVKEMAAFCCSSLYGQSMGDKKEDEIRHCEILIPKGFDIAPLESSLGLLIHAVVTHLVVATQSLSVTT